MTSFAQLSATAASVHLQAKGYRLTPSELFRNHTRGIMELNNGHFVALVGFRDDLAVIADPRYIGDDRAEEWSRARLENQWTRRILVISKPERKKPG